VQIGVVVASITKLEVVTAPIVSIRHMHRLMQVLDQMDEETKRQPAPGARGILIVQDGSKFGDLGDDASLGTTLTRENASA